MPLDSYQKQQNVYLFGFNLTQFIVLPEQSTSTSNTGSGTHILSQAGKAWKEAKKDPEELEDLRRQLPEKEEVLRVPVHKMSSKEKHQAVNKIYKEIEKHVSRPGVVFLGSNNMHWDGPGFYGFIQ